MRAAGNADYVAPADPGAPAAPADRRAPAGYAGPMDPVDPATPADPRNPADYAGPMDPGASEDGGKPPSKADRLERLAQGVAGVEGATCVVFGKFAIVGIDVDAKLERSQVGTIKYAVAEAFRKDPDGVDAIVTADIDLTQRLREIGADIRHGRPVAGFTEELADIVGRLVPQLPRSVMPAREPEDLGIRSSEPQTAR